MIAVALAALLCAEWSSAAEPGYRLSTHMLDVSLGRPASDVAVVLEELQGDGLWQRVAERRTDANGRVADLLRPARPATASTGCASRPKPTSPGRDSARFTPGSR